MRISSGGYLIKQGFKNLWHNRMLALTSVGVLTTSLVIVGIAMLITLNINSMVSYVESQNEIVVFLDDVDDEQVASLIKDISTNVNVANVEYISKEDGLKKQKDELGDAGALLDGLEEDNPLPDSFIVKVDNINIIGQTIKEIRGMENVLQVNAADDVTTTLVSIKKMINTFGIAIVVALSVISLVIITNAIKATIFTRRKEINIMKYVGATNTFIRIPFIVEGILLGGISAGLGFFIIKLGYKWFEDVFAKDTTMWLQQAFENIISFGTIEKNLLILFVIVGVLFGVCGSLISVRKYAKV